LGRVARYCDVDIEEFLGGTRQQKVVDARSILCYLSVRKLKLSGLFVAQKLNVSPSCVSKSVVRGHTFLSGTTAEEELLNK